MMETKAQVSGTVLGALGAFEAHLFHSGHRLPQGPAFVPVVCHSPIMLNQNSEGQRTKMSCVGNQWCAYLLQKIIHYGSEVCVSRLWRDPRPRSPQALDHWGPIQSCGAEPASRTLSLQSNQRDKVKGKLAPPCTDTWEGRGRLLRLMGNSHGFLKKCWFNV